MYNKLVAQEQKAPPAPLNSYERAAALLAKLKAEYPEQAKQLDELWKLFGECIPDTDKQKH